MLTIRATPTVGIVRILKFRAIVLLKQLVFTTYIEYTPRLFCLVDTSGLHLQFHSMKRATTIMLDR